MVNIKYYLIHCEQHTYREEHINNVRNLLGEPIEIFKGVYSKNLILEKDIITEYVKNISDNKIISVNFEPEYSGEIGCYLSHFKLVDKILNLCTSKTPPNDAVISQQCDADCVFEMGNGVNGTNNNSFIDDYSVIFEDDVTFEAGLHCKIQQIINTLDETNVDFDMIFLGLLFDNKGKNIIDNIFYINPENPCWGTHALLFKNKNIKKVYNSILNFNKQIDNQYKDSADTNQITAFVINPGICSQISIESTISDYYFINGVKTPNNSVDTNTNSDMNSSVDTNTNSDMNSSVDTNNEDRINEELVRISKEIQNEMRRTTQMRRIAQMRRIMKMKQEMQMKRTYQMKPLIQNDRIIQDQQIIQIQRLSRQNERIMKLNKILRQRNLTK